MVLAAVAVAAVLFRQELLRLLSSRPKLVDRITRLIQVVAGLILAAVAFNVLTD